jgi:hypothetical protein
MAEQDGAPAPPAPVVWEGKTYKSYIMEKRLG